MNYVIPAVLMVACIIWFLLYREIKKFLFIQSRYTDAQMLRQMLNEATERAVRLIEEQGIVKPDISAKKRIDASKNILNDTIREMGLEVTKFNTQGLIEAKRHEILHHTRTAGPDRSPSVGKTPRNSKDRGYTIY